MIIHTSLPAADVASAPYATTDGVHFARFDVRGSRTHPRAIDLILESDGTADREGTARNRRRNFGTSRTADRFDSSAYAASWSDWGWFLAAIFAADPSARTPYDQDAEAFARRTANVFTGTPPATRRGAVVVRA